MPTIKNKKPLRGGKLARAVINHIVKHPKEFNQKVFYHSKRPTSCETTRCFGGHVQVLAGFDPDRHFCRTQAMEALRIDWQTASFLFAEWRHFDDLVRFAAQHERKRPAKFHEKKGFA